MLSQQWSRVHTWVSSRSRKDYLLAAFVVIAVLLSASLSPVSIWAGANLQTPVSAPAFNPGDSRVNAAAGDRIAVYCNSTSGTIGVIGIDNSGQGFSLVTFTGPDILASLANQLVKSVEPYGSVFLRGDSQWNFTFGWVGGPFGATGVGSFGKTFNCNLASTISASSAVSTAVPTPTGLTLQSTGRVRVRSGPRATCAQIGFTTPRTPYTVLAKNRGGTWLQISIDGQNGWVSAGFVRVSSTRLLRDLPTLNVDCGGSPLP